jgi:D-glycero-alpha-D-manno-heptose-7-phosphate kinase
MGVTVIAPTRIDLAGGTLDIWPLNLFVNRPVYTLNMAIDIVTEATVVRRDDGMIVVASLDRGAEVSFPSVDKIHHRHKLGLLSRLAAHFLRPEHGGATITTRSHAPAGAGLAGSSSLNIAVTRALSLHTGARLNKTAATGVAKDVEAALLGVPTGLQDYAAALYGGINAFGFPAGGMTRDHFVDVESTLPERILLFYSGACRNSGINNWEMFKRLVDKEPKAVRGFTHIADAAIKGREALATGDMKSFDAAIRKEWEARRSLFPAISTPAIDAAIDAGKNAGARAARICGAGGGGCFFLTVDPDKREAVTAAVVAAGAEYLPFSLSKRGATSYNHPYDE